MHIKIIENENKNSSLLFSYNTNGSPFVREHIVPIENICLSKINIYEDLYSINRIIYHVKFPDNGFEISQVQYERLEKAISQSNIDELTKTYPALEKPKIKIINAIYGLEIND